MAMAKMAKLILSIRISDIPEILGNIGYLVALSSPEKLAFKESRYIFASRRHQCSDN